MLNAQDWQISDVRQQGNRECRPLPSPTVHGCFLAVKRVVRCRLIVVCQMLFVRKYFS